MSELTVYKALIRSKWLMSIQVGSLRQTAFWWNSSERKVESSAPLVTSDGTLIRAFHLAFQILCVYDYKTKVWRKQAEVVLNHENMSVLNTGKRQAQHWQYKWLNLESGQAYDCSIVYAAVNTIIIKRNVLHNSRTDLPVMYVAKLQLCILYIWKRKIIMKMK
jgi:hypothetical protein